MALPKENSSSCASPASRHWPLRSLRSPLSPIMHNHATPAPLPRRSKPLLPPQQGVRSPPHPRSPNPSYSQSHHCNQGQCHGHNSSSSLPVGRKLLNDGESCNKKLGVSRLRPLHQVGPPPSPSPDALPARAKPPKSSVTNPPRTKRQSLLFMHRTPLEPLIVGKVGAFSPKWLEQEESQKIEKPCRRRWRRIPRESILQSLRGDGKEILGHSMMNFHKDGKNSNPRSADMKEVCCKPKQPNPSIDATCRSRLGLDPQLLDEQSALIRPLDAKINLPGGADANRSSPHCVNTSVDRNCSPAHTKPTMDSGSNPCHELSLDVFALVEPNATCKLTPNGVSNRPEAACTSALATMGEFPCQSLVASPCKGVLPDITSEEDALTPPIVKSVTPTVDKHPTPPMQPTQSPDFIKRGVRAPLPINGQCFAAPCNFVKDRRKCKPRGVLTVDAGIEAQSSAESEKEMQISVHQMPFPAVASVEWMIDENKCQGGDSSPDFIAASADLCRMSFPRCFDSPCDEERPNVPLKDGEDVAEESKGEVLHTSTSLSGYEWRMSISQGMNSSCRTDTSPAHPRRSIVFNEDVARTNAGKTEPPLSFRCNGDSNIAVMMEDSVLLPVSSDKQDGECFPLSSFSLSEGSPPFQYPLLRLHRKDTDKEKVLDSLLKKNHGNSWPKCLAEEVMLSASAPLDSSLSSQEPELDLRSDTCSTLSPHLENWNAPLFCFKDKTYVQKSDGSPQSQLNMATEMFKPHSNDISSRIAMAKLLCNLTATYLDEVATCLGSRNADLGTVILSDHPVETTSAHGYSCEPKLDSLRAEYSSLLVGSRRMAECCSLLRGLALEASSSGGTDGISSECSVNQPSPSCKLDTAGSLLIQEHSYPSTCSELSSPLCRSSFERISSFGLMEPLGLCAIEEQVSKPQSCLFCPSEGSTWVPSRGMVAAAYFAIGIVVICHVYHRHVRLNRKSGVSSGYA